MVEFADKVSLDDYRSKPCSCYNAAFLTPDLRILICLENDAWHNSTDCWNNES